MLLAAGADHDEMIVFGVNTDRQGAFVEEL